MKIIFLSQYFHPEQFSNSRISRSLVEKGHQVDVVSCVPNYPEGKFFETYSNSRNREEMWNGVRIHRVWTIPRGRNPLQLVANYLAYAVASTFGARTLVKKCRPDVSFVSMPSPITQAIAGIYLKKVFKVPLVYWVQDIWPESATVSYSVKNPLIVRSLTWFCGWVYRQADVVLVQSQAFPPMITRFGVDLDRVRVFPNTAAKLYRPISPADAPEEGELIKGTGFRIMFAGNIGNSQDFDTIVDAAQQLHGDYNIDWVIIGGGRDLERLKKKVRDTGMEAIFQFPGRFPEERMPFFFSHADAMLVTLAKSEIFSLTVPYKVQTYMACGKPIVASLDGEGARIIIEAKAGKVAPSGTPELLARRIAELVEASEDERAEYGNNALSYFSTHYDAEKSNQRLIEHLQEAIRYQPRKRGVKTS
jgi:colanic acid biosynthesis glycosyl transferase WcaI